MEQVVLNPIKFNVEAASLNNESDLLGQANEECFLRQQPVKNLINIQSQSNMSQSDRKSINSSPGKIKSNFSGNNQESN